MRVSFCLTTMDVFASCLVFFLNFLVFLAIELLNVPLIAMLCRVNPKVSDRWREGGRESRWRRRWIRTWNYAQTRLPFDVWRDLGTSESEEQLSQQCACSTKSTWCTWCTWPALTTPSTATSTPSAATATTTIKKTAQERKCEVHTTVSYPADYRKKLFTNNLLS